MPVYTPSCVIDSRAMLMAHLISDAVLDTAYDWLCLRRREYPDHADIWDFRRDWAEARDCLRVELPSGSFRFGLLDRIIAADGETLDLWSARDALLLKALTITLAEVLPVSARCTDVKGHRDGPSLSGAGRRGLGGRNRFQLNG